MTTWARNANNVAVDVTTVNPSALFVASVAAQFVIVPDGTLNGATLSGGVWTNPAVTPNPAPPTYPELTPVQFYLSFTPTERMKIKALAASGGVPANSPLFSNATAIPQDIVIAEFWATFQIAQSINNPVNPNLVSIQEGLAYLADPTAPTPPVITTARIPEILAGTPQ